MKNAISMLVYALSLSIIAPSISHAEGYCGETAATKAAQDAQMDFSLLPHEVVASAYLYARYDSGLEEWTVDLKIYKYGINSEPMISTVQVLARLSNGYVCEVVEESTHTRRYTR